MIEIIARNGPPEAMLCPAFICDACRQQVVGEGNIVYRVCYFSTYRDRRDERRQTTPLFVAHKGECDLAIEALLDARYPGWLTYWEELEIFTRQLVHNLTHAFADDGEGEYVAQVVLAKGFASCEARPRRQKEPGKRLTA